MSVISPSSSGYVPITKREKMLAIKLPTYPHIAAFLRKNYPDGKIRGYNDPLGLLIHKIMMSQANRTPAPGNKKDHDDHITLFMSLQSQRVSTCRRYLNERQAGEINNFLRMYIQAKSRAYISTYLMFDRCMTRAVDYAMERLGISECVNYKDALIKDFQRFRKDRPEFMIYKND